MEFVREYCGQGVQPHVDTQTSRLRTGCLIFVRSRDKLRQVVKEISGTHAGGFKGRISKRQHQAQLSVRETVTSTPAIFLHGKAAREEGWNFEAGSRKACSRSRKQPCCDTSRSSVAALAPGIYRPRRRSRPSVAAW